MGVKAAPGDPFTFSFTYGSVSADLRPEDPAFGAYALGNGSASFTIGSFEFIQPQPLSLFGFSAKYSFPGPQDQITIASVPFNFGPFALGIILGGVDRSGLFLGNDAWPADPVMAFKTVPNLTAHLTVWPDALEGGGQIAGGPAQIAQEPAVVPEPTTLLLLRTGLIGAVGAGRLRGRLPR